MRNQLYLPQNEKVRKVISCIGYVEMEDTDSTEGWFGMCPNGTSNLTISLDDDLQFHNNHGNSILYTSYHSPAAIKRRKNLKFINVQFNLLGIYSIKGIPMNEFLNKSLALDQFFSNQECEELKDRINGDRKLLNKFSIVEEFLASRVNPDLPDPRVQHALGLISKYQMNMDELSNEVCLSSRRFRELFSEQTGFSPNFYKKVNRLYKSLRQLTKNPETPLTQIALSNSFYDQAHFIKDFRVFTGMTPSEFLTQRAKISDFYNYDLREL